MYGATKGCHGDRLPRSGELSAIYLGFLYIKVGRD